MLNDCNNAPNMRIEHHLNIFVAQLITFCNTLALLKVLHSDLFLLNFLLCIVAHAYMNGDGAAQILEACPWIQKLHI